MITNNLELRQAALANKQLLGYALMSGNKEAQQIFMDRQKQYEQWCTEINPEHNYQWFDRFDYEDAYRCRYCLKNRPEDHE